MRYSVFLSHGQADLELALALKSEIERFEVDVYMFEHDPQFGGDLPKKLINRIKSSDALIVLLTQAAANSAAVNAEVGVAVGEETLVIPLVEQGVDPLQFTLLQGKEFVPFQRHDAHFTIQAIADYVEQLRRRKTRMAWGVGAIVTGLLWWAHRTGDEP